MRFLRAPHMSCCPGALVLFLLTSKIKENTAIDQNYGPYRGYEGVGISSDLPVLSPKATSPVKGVLLVKIG